MTMIKQIIILSLMLMPLLMVVSTSASATSSTGKGIERITLKKTAVIGSQELPRIISIMSWKKTAPLNVPLLHRKLQMDFNPVDQTEFSREIVYRRQMSQ